MERTQHKPRVSPFPQLPYSRIHDLVRRAGLTPLRISQGRVTALYGREEVEQNH
jgi:hypothetical protein